MLLDAFRYDYLNEKNTPFLWKCSQEGEYYRTVEQSLGYCERSEILTGLQPNETGFFTAIGYDPEKSPFKELSILRLLDLMETLVLLPLSFLPRQFSNRLHKKLRSYFSKYFLSQNIKMPSYMIPYPWLRYFNLTEDQIDHRNRDAFPSSSILDLLDVGGRTYCYETFTALGLSSPYLSDKDRLDGVLRDTEKSLKDLYLVYIAAPDAYGHLYGPDSPELAAVLKNLDADLEVFVKKLEKVSPGNRYLFLGDHGMLKVTSKVNLEKEIKCMLRKHKLKKGKDLIYFLDSTMVRFWVISDKGRSLLPSMINSSEIFKEFGTWMDEGMATSFHIPWPDRRYGDYLWVANPGVLVFPDFFQSFLPYKGMHGYHPSLPESKGVCIHWGENIAPAQFESMRLTDTFSVLKRSLRL